MAGSFAAWMAAVDRAVEAKCGMSAYDLDDAPYADWFEDGVSVKSAASRAIRNAGGGAFGF